METIYLDQKYCQAFTTASEIEKKASEIQIAYKELLGRNGKGNDFLGWLSLPDEISTTFLNEIDEQAKKIQKIAKIFVVIGIGGSYLGARAVLESLQSQIPTSNLEEGKCHILYAGHHLSEDYMCELTAFLDKHEYALCVISKSGTTTEPAIAFRILKNHIEKKYGKENARERIIAITDKDRGALKELAIKEGYKSYIVPDNVGGRYSVLTPVGLLPIAVGGGNIHELIKGAQKMQKIATASSDIKHNICMEYAVLRNIFYAQGKKVELMVNYDPRLFFFSEWWKQLFGESEGKEGKGIFPSSVSFTSDLHSMGQYIQNGERILFETVLWIDKNKSHFEIPYNEENADGMNFIAGKRIGYVNEKAQEGTCLAHNDGGVPNIRICVPELNEYYIGQLIYFYEFTCGLSAYHLGVNPFDQPGVEAYKKNMFRLLGK